MLRLFIGVGPLSNLLSSQHFMKSSFRRVKTPESAGPYSPVSNLKCHKRCSTGAIILHLGVCRSVKPALLVHLFWTNSRFIGRGEHAAADSAAFTVFDFEAVLICCSGNVLRKCFVAWSWSLL